MVTISWICVLIISRLFIISLAACDISLPEPHDPTDDVMLVLWYREDLGRPIYRFIKNILNAYQIHTSLFMYVCIHPHCRSALFTWYYLFHSTVNNECSKEFVWRKKNNLHALKILLKSFISTTSSIIRCLKINRVGDVASNRE